MKVLYFHQHFSTPKGSSGTRSYSMARALIAAGHEVTMVCGSYRGGVTGISLAFRDGCREGDVDGIHVVEFDLSYANADRFSKRTCTFFSYAMRSIGLALTRDYDLLFATTTPLTASTPGIFARWLRGKPFVFEVRDLWPELPRAMGVIKNPLVLWAMGILEWVSYHSAHHCIALAPGIREGISTRGIRPECISTLPNGCDLHLMGAINEQWRPAAVPPMDLMAVYAGTHGIANGLDAVLDAAIELQRRSRADIKLVLIGDGKEKSRLVARATEAKLKNIVFCDPVSKHKLSGLLASADVGLQILANVKAFYYGTSPNKFFDYLAAGKPVLTNYPGWVADMIQENACGFPVPPEDPIAFANALEAAANDRTALIAMGENSRALAEREYDRGKLAQNFVALLEAAATARLAR